MQEKISGDPCCVGWSHGNERITVCCARNGQVCYAPAGSKVIYEMNVLLLSRWGCWGDVLLI